MLSFLTYQKWSAQIKGLEDFPQDLWPDRVALLYYSYHVMVGLGTIFIAVMLMAALLLWRGTLFESRWMLWPLILSAPLPYIANTAGWMTAELGRQPWLIYGLLRTAHGASPRVSAGNVWFTLLGFMGMYAMLSILFLFLMGREIEIGPDGHDSHHPEPSGQPGRHPPPGPAVVVAGVDDQDDRALAARKGADLGCVGRRCRDHLVRRGHGPDASGIGRYRAG